MNCIRVHRSDEGAYTVPGDSEIEDWAEVVSAADKDAEIKLQDSLKGWGWERVYRISTPIGGGWSDMWYFVSQGPKEEEETPC
jgi:hypothetical protein